jgi:zinc protease
MKPIIKQTLHWLSILVISVSVLTACSATGPEPGYVQSTADTSCISLGWPHDTSDLQPDPSLVFGTLNNGLRYVIMKNEEPKDRVGLYLDIQAGSLHETDDQQGLAHYLEHMMFNGSTHYPPGTLVEYFQSIGMSFGADTNAHTTFDETVYRLLLPTGGRKHLEDGLLVMADYARGALLLESEVDRERGIILAEKRTRDSAGYRLYEKRTRFLFAGTRLAKRLPIGIDETLTKANAALLREYYDAWYRPENMILVIVGDMDIALVEELVVERFSSLVSPSVQPQCYDFGTVVHEGTSVLYLHEPELGHTVVSINSRWNESPRIDSIAQQTRQLNDYVAVSLMNNRLKRLVNQPDSPFTQALTYGGTYLQRIGYATVTAKTEGEKWEEGIELLNLTLREVLKSGFTDKELQRVKKEIKADLMKEVQTSESRDSRKLASQIINKLNSNEVFFSPQQELDLYGPIVDSLELDDVNRIFRSMWSHDNRQVLVAGTAKINGEQPEGEAAVLNVFERSEKKELVNWVEAAGITFPYLPVPEQSVGIVSREYMKDIDAYTVVYHNKTVLNMKKTDFQPNEVLLSVQFGQGKLSANHAGLAMLAEAVVRESGFAQLNRDELDEALAGRNAGISFKVGHESFTINGKGLSSEMELLLQLIRTQLVDPAFRPEAYRLSMDRFNQMYEQMESSVEGIMRMEGERFLAGGNEYFGLPDKDQFKNLTLEQVIQWLGPVFSGAPLEITVVGDIEPEQIEGLVGQYLGTLERTLPVDSSSEKVTFPSGEKLFTEVPTQIDKALVVIAWPTDDFWDISRTRRLNVLSTVFDDRLRLEIREKMGAVYSPAVYNRSSRVAPGYGVLKAILTVDPIQADEVAERVRQVGFTLAAEGVTGDELNRALEPTLTSIKDMMRSNRYWLQSVLSLSSRHPEQLQWPLSIQRDFAGVTVEEINRFASRYLQREKSAELIFRPVPK